MDGGGAKLNGAGSVSPSQCKDILRERCTPEPSTWNRLQMYNVQHGGSGATPQNFTDYTAEFLLTRGPYAMLGYSWCGCTNGDQARPRAAEWDKDYGKPLGACKETG